jgi:iron complex outermembrane recepter protein
VKLHPTAKAAAQLLALGALASSASAVLAQTAPAPAGSASAPASTVQRQQRIEITGSSIKRLADEGALPVEVITAEDIRQRGIASVEELVNSISASAPTKTA